MTPELDALLTSLEHQLAALTPHDRPAAGVGELKGNRTS
jgi:hypothetical protein